MPSAGCYSVPKSPDFPVNPESPPGPSVPEQPPICRCVPSGTALHVLLAMQKVEGSNPFSCFRKGLRLQVFFVGAVAWCV
jgi:hypothetical protein